MTKQTERTLSVACPTCKVLPGQLCREGDRTTHISCHERKMKGRELQKQTPRRRQER